MEQTSTLNQDATDALKNLNAEREQLHKREGELRARIIDARSVVARLEEELARNFDRQADVEAERDKWRHRLRATTSRHCDPAPAPSASSEAAHG